MLYVAPRHMSVIKYLFLVWEHCSLFSFIFFNRMTGFFRSLTLLLIELNTLLVFTKLWDGEHLRYLFHIYFNLSSLNEFLNIKVESSFLLSFLYPFLPSFYFFLKRNDYDHCWVSRNSLILYVDFPADNVRSYLIFFSDRKHKGLNWIYTLD